MLQYFALFTLMVAALNSATDIISMDIIWIGDDKYKVVTPESMPHVYRASLMYDGLIKYCEDNMKKLKSEELEIMKDLLYEYLFTLAQNYYMIGNMDRQVSTLIDTIKDLEFIKLRKAKKWVTYEMLSTLCSRYGKQQEINVNKMWGDHFMHKDMLPIFLEMITKEELSKEDRLCFGRLFSRIANINHYFGCFYTSTASNEEDDLNDKSKGLAVLNEYVDVLNEQSITEKFGKFSFYKDMKTDIEEKITDELEKIEKEKKEKELRADEDEKQKKGEKPQEEEKPKEEEKQKEEE